LKRRNAARRVPLIVGKQRGEDEEARCVCFLARKCVCMRARIPHEGGVWTWRRESHGGALALAASNKHLSGSGAQRYSTQLTCSRPMGHTGHELPLGDTQGRTRRQTVRPHVHDVHGSLAGGLAALRLPCLHSVKRWHEDIASADCCWMKVLPVGCVQHDCTHRPPHANELSFELGSAREGKTWRTAIRAQMHVGKWSDWL